MLGLAETVTLVTLKGTGWVVCVGVDVGIPVGGGLGVTVAVGEDGAVAVDDLVDGEVVSGPWVTPPFAPWPARVT